MTVPLPVPELVVEIHGTLPVVDQMQSAPAVTLAVPAPPLPLKDTGEVGAKVNVHAVAPTWKRARTRTISSSPR